MKLGRISSQQWSVKFEPNLNNEAETEDCDDFICDDCYVVTPEGFHIARIHNPDA